MSKPGSVDVLVIGAGFGGLYSLHTLRGRGFDVRVVETGSGVGAAWHWNDLPRVRCDVDSLDYRFSFPDLQQDWAWTERYATQPEITRYLGYFDERLNTKRSIAFDTPVRTTDWMATENRWRVEADTGTAVSCRFLILATLSLLAAKLADIPGTANFEGFVPNTWSRMVFDGIIKKLNQALNQKRRAWFRCFYETSSSPRAGPRTALI